MEIPLPGAGRQALGLSLHHVSARHHLLPPVGDEGLQGGRRPRALPKVGLIFIHF